MQEARIGLIGFGNVGQGFCDLLRLKARALEGRYGLRVRLMAVSDIKLGSVYSEDGLKPDQLLKLVAQGRRLESYGEGTKGLDALETIDLPLDLIVEATWTNLETGEPGLTHIQEALKSGKDVVTTNKGPIALAYRELRDLAKSCGRQLRFKGTVMSGTPSFDLALETIPGCEVIRAEGILNGTCNFILTRMSEGWPYEKALQDATSRGYAEADPSADVEGWDSVAKAVILGNVLMGGQLKVQDVDRRGIAGLQVGDLRRARGHRSVLKLLTKVWRDAGHVRASVAPEEVPLEHPLANVRGAMNGLTLATDSLGEITIVGPGAGGRETGQAVMSDIIRVALGRNRRT